MPINEVMDKSNAANHTPGFLNRLQEQLAPVMHSTLEIENHPDQTRLAIKDGYTPPSASDHTSHLLIEDAHSKEILHIMNSAF